VALLDQAGTFSDRGRSRTPVLDRARLEAIVREAGARALANWPGAGHAPEVWDKSPGNPVCAVDLAVDAYLRRELGRLLPAAGWLSEETADAPDRLAGGLIWLVDPIDGTRDFIRGRTGWAVSVALISEGRPLFGMLCAPARAQEQGGEFWHGESGVGSWRNGERLVASSRTELAGARVPADHLDKPDRDLTLVDKPNSIALRIAMVAADEADLVATLRWGWEWDIGAAALIAREAGAAVSDAFGRTPNYNKRDPRAFGLLVTAPAIHQSAIERLAERARKLAG
jgi:myo-inositol-1(or 4)-monophosphatase